MDGRESTVPPGGIARLGLIPNGSDTPKLASAFPHEELTVEAAEDLSDVGPTIGASHLELTEGDIA